MQGKTLEISKLSESGGADKTVICRSGRVSAFRAHSDTLLESYMKALCGVDQEEKFAVHLNGQVFNPTEHILLGFNKKPIQSDRTVYDMLSSCDLDADELQFLVNDFGLAEFRDTPVSELGKVELHCFTILYATSRNDSIIIAKDPFLPISEKYREKYAARLTQYAWDKQSIVVVARLCWRPQCWIDNDLIARIQIDQTVRRATIGIGSDNQLKSLVSQIRKDLNPEDSEPKKATARAHIVDDEGNQAFLSTGIDLTSVETNSKFDFAKRHVISLSAIGCLLMLIAIMGLFILQKEPQTVMVKNNSASQDFTNEGDAMRKTSNGERRTSTDKNNRRQPDSVVNENAGGALALASYQSDVKKSILRAFKGEIDLSNVEDIKSNRPKYPTKSSSSYNNNKSFKKPNTNFFSKNHYQKNNTKKQDSQKAREIFQKLIEMRQR